ncbi:hypothetical protein KZC54_06945 [Microbacterium sp. KSW4-6]|uniref:Uncharacterized protein n=2 Tax=Microbacterium galbinum TaxID=2851646 RepID=A0ABY4ITM0_9MICO|nr:hypothetical protein [Microbacterium galbinum]UPL16156.1 hypothetical protein KV396_09825 [Microbacterium galbinum]
MTVRVGEDYFWSIPADQLYDVTAAPSGLTIGQLSESFDNIRELDTSPDRAISYGLVWLSDLLRAIGQSEVS